MIIYNNNKKFLGIDEESLKSLGFSNLADLQSEAADFADLFVKTPGFVHNFKHVHWIDFVLCEEDKNACKAIIHTKGKNLNCILEIKTIYLTSSPNSKSYIINLINLRNLSSNETSDISNELQTRDVPATVIHEDEDEETQKIEIEETDTQEIEIEDTIQTRPIKKIIIDDPYEINDDLSLDDELSQEQLDVIGEPDTTIEIDIDNKKEEIVEEISSNIDEDQQNDGFDIQITAEILDMDVATIEDFVNDFITQAKEFKNKLYDSIAQEDIIVLKGLSHQLKGVAANLRIHDCQNILIKINNSDDLTTSKTNLDTFYKYIAKLSGEEPSVTSDTKIEEQKINEPNIDEDDYILEIDDIISTETNNKNDSISDIDDFDSLDVEQDINLEANEEEFSIEEESNEVESFEDLSLEPDSELEEPENEPVKKYDKTKIAVEIGLDEQSFNELFQDYTDESQDLISIIQTSINNDDSTDWRHSAIKLKGMSDNMRIDSFAPELETLVSTDDKASAQDALEQLEVSLSQIITTKD